MDLVARVLQALTDRPVNTAEFERCACALLVPRYPGLSAVEGGHDLGRDADIYFPFGDGDANNRGRLLVTTGDPAANLRTGLRRMREEGVNADLVVVACLGPVNARARATLDSICAGYDLGPPHVYARDWLVAALVQQPAWRQRLLGVAGELGALLDRPLALLEQATAEPALVGRGAERSALNELVGSGADAIVVGVPGVGKTRLTAELDGCVMFLEQADSGQVVDDLLRARPDGIVVDDAHARAGELRILRRARQQERLTFSIIATTWPDKVDDVAASLPGACVLPVDLLELADMNVLVESVGVTGRRARAAVLDQAEGRPGWALALCESFVQGQGFDVVTGAAHLANVERFLRRATESEIALDALACVAALGHMPAHSLHQLAPLLGIPAAVLFGLMNRVARNGLVEQTGGGWRLQPALRAPLVARWFFTDPPGRPWPTLQAAFPDSLQDLTRSVIMAARVGSAAARRTAESWVASLPEVSHWDTATVSLVGEYSTLSEDAARFAVRQARSVLSGPRDTEHIWGFDHDPTGAAAARQLSRAARQWLLPEAITGLLDLAIGDDRPRPQTQDHPLRVLMGMATQIDPDFGTDVEIRERLLECTLSWLAEDASVGRWPIATEVLASAFDIEVSGAWMEPGAPNTLSWSRGVDSVEHLDHLLRLWERVDAVLRADRHADPPRCPPEALTFLVDLAGRWLRIGAGFAPSAAKPSDEQQRLGARGGRVILESLRPALQAVPGLALRAQRLLDVVARRNDIPSEMPAVFAIDPDLQDLVGEGIRRADDIDAKLRDRAAAVDGLADRLADLGPRAGTAKLDELLQHARLAGGRAVDTWVTERMRLRMADPAAWYEAAAEAHNPVLLRSALTQWLVVAPRDIPDHVLTGTLHEPNLRAAVISAALDRTEVDQITELVIAELRAEDAPLLEQFFVRDAPDEVLHRLLLHPVPAIAGAAAISFAVGQLHGPALPMQWLPGWRDAIRRLRAEDLDQHSQWRMGELLEHLSMHDPDLFEDWFTTRIDEVNERGYLSVPEPHGCEHHLARLPQSHRERLARRWAGRQRGSESLLVHLIGPDRDLAERLITDGIVTDDELLDVLSGQHNEILERIGRLLLERDIAPARIAAAAGTIRSMAGLDSVAYRRTLEYFDNLAEHARDLTSIAEAGRSQQREQLDAAEASERQDRIRGR